MHFLYKNVIHHFGRLLEKQAIIILGREMAAGKDPTQTKCALLSVNAP